MRGLSFETIRNKNPEVLLLDVPSFSTKTQLMNWYAENLYFPYFGYNWDALNDCLWDLSWIPTRDIWLYHDHLPDLAHDDLRIYLEILEAAAVGWADEGEHNLRVIFAPHLEQRVRGILASSAGLGA